jgi:hypothetical protein
LTVCGVLLVLDLFAWRRTVELGAIVLALVGVGLRIEAAIINRTADD